MNTPTSSQSSGVNSDSLRDLIAKATTEEELIRLEKLLGLPPESPEPLPTSSRWHAATLGDVAGFFGVELPTVKQWRCGPNPMPGNEGAWPLDEIARWRVAKAQALVRDPGLLSELEKENLELANLRHRIKLRKEAGELVDRAAAKATIAQMFHRIRGRLQAMPEELASGMPGDLRNRLLVEIQDRMRLLLREMENWQFDDSC